MPLGLSAETYRWIAFPWMRIDRPAFGSSGHYAPHILSVSPPADDEGVAAWLIGRTRAHGLRALYLDAGLLGSEAEAGVVGQSLAGADITAVASVSVDLTADQESWGSPADENAIRAARFDGARATSLLSGWTGPTGAAIAVRAMRLARAAGAVAISLVHGQPDRPNRYWSDPPLAGQLVGIERNVRGLLPPAEELGLTIALEPHMDYRAAELAGIVTAIDSPALRMILDVADPLAVNEDPLAAARRVAPFVVGTHLRDMRVQHLTEIATGTFFHTPIGEGSVPIREVLEVLEEAAEYPGDLLHFAEIVTTPDHDVEAWLTAGLEWLRANGPADWAESAG